MKKTIKELNTYIKSQQQNRQLLFGDATGYLYPNIPDDNHNFISDYNLAYELYDAYFVKEYGDRIVEYDVDTISELFAAWYYDITATTYVFIDAWARLYYALNINYNPVYNVEEHIETEYGEHETENVIGERSRTKGQQQNTRGGGTDTSTIANVAIDSVLEKESSKQTDVIASRTDTDGSRTDTEEEATDTTTSKTHTDTVDRSGNIGTVSATELLTKEIDQKKRLSFFKTIFLVFVEEVGAYYEPNFLQ